MKPMWVIIEVEDMPRCKPARIRSRYPSPCFFNRKSFCFASSHWAWRRCQPMRAPSARRSANFISVANPAIPPSFAQEFVQRRDTVREGDRARHVLAQKALDRRPQSYRPIEFGVMAGAVATDGYHVPALVEAVVEPLEALSPRHLLGRNDGGHYATDRGADVDSGKMTGIRELAGQHEMTVEDRPRRIRDRIIGVVALHQHSIESSDAAGPFFAVAGPFTQGSDPPEYRRRITPACRDLADGEPDFALRHRKARQRIHQQKHMLSLIAKVFGDRHRPVRPVHAPQRRGIRGCGNDDGFDQSAGTEYEFDEFLDLAAALSN